MSATLAGSAEELVLESVAALQTHVLIPLCEHALRDLKALPTSSSSSPSAFAFASAVRADAGAVTGPTGELHTLVFAPPPPPQQQTPSAEDQTDETSPAAAAAASLAVGRARRVNVPQDADEMSPAEAAELAAQQRAAQLPARLQRIQVLLRDLFAVLDFTCATLLGGSLRCCFYHTLPWKYTESNADIKSISKTNKCDRSFPLRIIFPVQPKVRGQSRRSALCRPRTPRRSFFVLTQRQRSCC